MSHGNLENVTGLTVMVAMNKEKVAFNLVDWYCVLRDGTKALIA